MIKPAKNNKINKTLDTFQYRGWLHAFFNLLCDASVNTVTRQQSVVTLMLEIGACKHGSNMLQWRGFYIFGGRQHDSHFKNAGSTKVPRGGMKNIYEFNLNKL